MKTISLIRLWGVLDLTCALTLLNIIVVPVFSNIHELIFTDPHDLLSIRSFGWLVLLNSIIRISFHSHRCNKLVSFSYLLEFYVYFTEVFIYKTMNDTNVLFISQIICLVMAVIMYNLKQIFLFSQGILITIYLNCDACFKSVLVIFIDCVQ